MGDADDTNSGVHLVKPLLDPTLANLANLVPRADGVIDEDAALVERARRGDRSAFGQLFERHHGRIHGMCARLLRRSDDVDDAVQQTFLEGWRCLGRFEGKSRFTTWLTRIAIHTCFSTRRRLRRLLLVNQPDDDEGGGPRLNVVDGVLHDTAPLSADEIASRHARERALNDVLAAVSEKKRAVFVLVDLEGLTSPEAAEILGINEATVRTRLFYVRQEIAAAVRVHPGFADLERVHR